MDGRTLVFVDLEERVLLCRVVHHGGRYLRGQMSCYGINQWAISSALLFCFASRSFYLVLPRAGGG